MAKQPVIGLGDISFDPSLQTDEVDHDFFDNPAPLFSHGVETYSEPVNASGSTQRGSSFRSGLSEIPLEPIAVTTDTISAHPNSLQIFSTGTLLACLNTPQTDHRVDKPVSGTEKSFQQFTAGGLKMSISTESQRQMKKSKRLPGDVKLFDISDSSSDDSEKSGEESDEELNNFMEKYYDFIDRGDSDYSDITEVSPMSSLTVSPLPVFVSEGSGAEDSNHSSGVVAPSPYGNVGNNQHENCSEEIKYSSNSNNSEVNFMLRSDFKSSSQTLVTKDVSINSSFKNDFKDHINKDQNQNGDHSSSGSSVASACGSANSSCASSLAFTSSSSRVSSSASSSCSSLNQRKAGRNLTFTPEQLKRIERENGILLKKILDTQKHSHHHHHGGHRGTHRSSGYRSVQCSAGITRQKQQRRIDHENLILMKRLQSAKPSRDIGEAFKNNNS